MELLASILIFDSVIAQAAQAAAADAEGMMHASDDGVAT